MWFSYGLDRKSSQGQQEHGSVEQNLVGVMNDLLSRLPGSEYIIDIQVPHLR